MKSRTTARGRARRDQLLDVALEPFAAKGYRGASLSAIAEQVGLSEPGLLHHFPTKVALLEATLEHHQTRALAQAYAPIGGRTLSFPERHRAARGRARGGFRVRAAAAGDRGREHRARAPDARLVRRPLRHVRAALGARAGRRPGLRDARRGRRRRRAQPACWWRCSTAPSSSSCWRGGTLDIVTPLRHLLDALLRRAQLSDVELQRRRDACAAAGEQVLQLQAVERGDDRPRRQPSGRRRAGRARAAGRPRPSRRTAPAMRS